MPDFQQVKSLFHILKNPDASDRDFDSAEAKLKGALGDSLFSTLDYIDDIDGAEFQKAFEADTPKAAKKRTVSQKLEFLI